MAFASKAGCREFESVSRIFDTLIICLTSIQLNLITGIDLISRGIKCLGLYGEWP